MNKRRCLIVQVSSHSAPRIVCPLYLSLIWIHCSLSLSLNPWRWRYALSYSWTNNIYRCPLLLYICSCTCTHLPLAQKHPQSTNNEQQPTSSQCKKPGFLRFVNSKFSARKYVCTNFSTSSLSKFLQPPLIPLS